MPSPCLTRVVAGDVTSRVVVGVDGSEGSARALRWAADEARLRGARLEIVHAWAVPFMGEVPTTPDLDAELEAGARTTLEEAMAAVDLQGLEVDGRIERGPAAVVLVELAKGADLLVMGSRGRGGFTGLLLGSVSQQCAHHASCPIVIVPPADR
jgi:nucleotide-binding universal stress UspA family protein